MSKGIWRCIAFRRRNFSFHPHRPAEAYLRTYLWLFGGLAPAEVERRARGDDKAALFDTWGDYLVALGLPDHGVDLPVM
ncbi:hypothetical protein [Sorangium sp. So ce426]|uniref:hypothetical protein n=1 Tax=unclassified Sorangium TaxID=2621164 RepID=UPI003F5B5BE7